MSDTPRTDRAIAQCDDSGNRPTALIEMARQLERELNEVTQRLAVLNEDLRHLAIERDLME